MENLNFKFRSSPEDRFLLGDEPLEMSVDYSNHLLTVSPEDEEPRTYVLQQEGAPVEPAIYVVRQGNECYVEIGSVDFMGAAVDLDAYPMNMDGGHNFIFRVSKDGGHIGILDIRDVARQTIVTTYYWDLVPVILSQSGNDLEVATMEYDPDLGLAPWRIEHP